MLDGITILNREVITQSVMPNETLFRIAGLIFVITLVLTIVFMIEKWDAVGCCTALICLVAVVICMIQTIRSEDIPTDRYRYEVTVGPYVRFTDIYERYDVVERRGEIWVLEDKERE